MTDRIEPEKSQYDHLHDMSIEGWTWEFTRRNPVYQAACERYASHAIVESDQKTVPEISEKEVAAAAQFGLLFFC